MDDIAFASFRFIFSFGQRMESIVICSDPGGGGDNGVMAMLILLTFVLATAAFVIVAFR